MLGSLEMTRDALVSAVKRKDPGDYTLNVVVVRLLAIALTVSRWQTNPVRSEGLPVPKPYRTWPLIESDVDVSGIPWYLRFAVCPKAASVTDEETFPVGTALVVETFSSAPGTGGQLRSVFVMEKVSSLDPHDSGKPSRDGWAYATYDAVGRVVAGDALDCGVCRLPVM
jgi:hypothetical protein